MFKKRKDHLYDLIKNSIKQQSTNNFLDYLQNAQVLNLAICSKKYYLLLHPKLIQIKLNIEDQSSEDDKNLQHRNKNKGAKKNKKKKQKSASQEEQFEVEVSRFPLSKAIKQIQKNNWVKIQKLPYQNSYLQKKMDTGVNFFYQKQGTNELLFLNRSLVDPKLNYEMGGFNGDLENEYKNNIYTELYEGQIGEMDFTSQQSILSRHKQILTKIQQKKQEIQKMQQINYENELNKMQKLKKIAVILCFGGSFSFGIYQNGKCILHKSDKKYVCRKKAGQRQLNKDKQSGSQIKSMGSQIRRDQQKKHISNVYQILTSNKQAIESCQLVFLQAPGLNRLFIINDSQTLSGVKDRLRSVCITAKKANFTQIEALYSQITKIAFVKAK